MCEINRRGNLGMPYAAYIHTGIEKCQRTGVFVNGSGGSVEVMTSGYTFTIPAGKTATMPVGEEIYVNGDGKGLLVWSVTNAVLPARVDDAPQIKGNPEPATSERQVVQAKNISGPNGNTNAEIFLGSGNYNKLVFLVEE